jgi:hypothetical protein
MNTSSFPAVARTLYVRPRLRLGDVPRSEKTDWALIKGAIDGALDELAMTVKARRRDIVVRAGAHSGGAVLLFAYRTFRLEGRPEADPIVAGVTFLNEDGAIRARADLCREDSGVIVGGAIEQVLRPEDDVEDIAASLAAHLARSADELISAVDAAPAERE